MNVVDALCMNCEHPIQWLPVTPRLCSKCDEAAWNSNNQSEEIDATRLMKHDAENKEKSHVGTND